MTKIGFNPPILAKKERNRKKKNDRESRNDAVCALEEHKKENESASLPQSIFFNLVLFVVVRFLNPIPIFALGFSKSSQLSPSDHCICLSCLDWHLTASNYATEPLNLSVDSPKNEAIFFG